MNFKSTYSLTVTLLIFSISLSLISCNKVREEKKFTKTIGVSLLTRGHIFYRDLEEGLKLEARKNNYELIITSADWDLGKQISQIEDFISRKVDAIIVSPVDSRGIGSGIDAANGNEIPVFTADIAAEQGNVISHIASDNKQGGKLAGEFLARFLKGEGEIAIINQPAITSVLDRVQGFKEAISSFPEIKIVADVNGLGVRDRSLEAATDILQAHPGLKGIFGINDDSALGALDAVQQYKKSSIVIIGYDATPPAVDAILKNTPLKADVVQYPKLIGETTIIQIKNYFDGKHVPKVVPVQVGIVDRESLEKEKAN
jgi:ribose transport system substrate-binding protein